MSSEDRKTPKEIRAESRRMDLLTISKVVAITIGLVTLVTGVGAVFVKADNWQTTQAAEQEHRAIIQQLRTERDKSLADETYLRAKLESDIKEELRELRRDHKSQSQYIQGQLNAIYSELKR